ncbi:FecR domain-containing protein [Flavilitoribacter nigricans]|nr:FecR domain-containing protein [Flavilitoribacter nigricans]
MIHKHLRNELSEADQLVLQNWLDQDPEHRRALEDIERTWDLGARYLATYSPDVEGGLTKLQARIRQDKQSRLTVVSSKKRFNFSFTTAIAAALLFLVAALVVWNFWFTPAEMLIVTTGPGEQKTIPLADGSTVILNENSQLNYPSFFRSDRAVELSGEAYFEINRDEDHTFTIQTSRTKTEVLGTSFNLRAYHNENFTEVEVVKGLVRLADTAGKSPMELNQGSRGTYQHDLGTILSDKPKTLNASYWRERRLRFKGHQLDEAIKEINSRLGMNIQIQNQQISQCSLTLNVALDHPDTIVAVIADIFSATWAKSTDGNYQISGGDCISG